MLFSESPWISKAILYRNRVAQRNVDDGKVLGVLAWEKQLVTTLTQTHATRYLALELVVEQSRYRGRKPSSSLILFGKEIILKFPIPGT